MAYIISKAVNLLREKLYPSHWDYILIKIGAKWMTILFSVTLDHYVECLAAQWGTKIKWETDICFLSLDFSFLIYNMKEIEIDTLVIWALFISCYSTPYPQPCTIVYLSYLQFSNRTKLSQVSEKTYCFSVLCIFTPLKTPSPNFPSLILYYWAQASSPSRNFAHVLSSTTTTSVWFGFLALSLIIP